jgi:hypothetical protein
MNNHGHGEMHTIYGNALVLVGFHIDFAHFISGSAPVQKKKII